MLHHLIFHQQMEQSLRKFYDKAVNCGKLIPLSNYNK